MRTGNSFLPPCQQAGLIALNVRHLYNLSNLWFGGSVSLFGKSLESATIPVVDPVRSQAKSKIVFYILMAISAALLAPYSGCHLLTKAPLSLTRDGDDAEDALPIETSNEDPKEDDRGPLPTKPPRGLADIEKLLEQ